MKTTTIRVDDDLMKLTHELARLRNVSTADVIRDELRKTVDAGAERDPAYAAFVHEVGRKRYVRERANVTQTLGAFAAECFMPLPNPENAPPHQNDTL
jgi:predicted transcriptional regulator